MATRRCSGCPVFAAPGLWGTPSRSAGKAVANPAPRGVTPFEDLVLPDAQVACVVTSAGSVISRHGPGRPSVRRQLTPYGWSAAANAGLQPVPITKAIGILKPVFVPYSSTRRTTAARILSLTSCGWLNTVAPVTARLPNSPCQNASTLGTKKLVM
jgi:hypothetical protein